MSSPGSGKTTTLTRTIELLKDKELYAEKSNEAKKWASQWSLDTLTEKLVTYYEEALAIRKKR